MDRTTRRKPNRSCARHSRPTARLYGDRTEAVLADWLELGDELTELSRFDESVAMLRNAVDLARALHGPVHSTVRAHCRSRRNPSVTQDVSMRPSAFSARRSMFSRRCTDRARRDIDRTRRICSGTSNTADATRTRSRAASSWQRSWRTSSAGRPELRASNYTSIGVDYGKVGRFEEAEAAIRKALAIWAALQGSNDEWDSADPMLGLAEVLRCAATTPKPRARCATRSRSRRSTSRLRPAGSIAIAARLPTCCAWSTATTKRCVRSVPPSPRATAPNPIRSSACCWPG